MKNKTFFRYLAELAIVITGVTIAFWLNTRAEEAKERRIVKNYYQELHSDLESDRKALAVLVQRNQHKMGLMSRAISFCQW